MPRPRRWWAVLVAVGLAAVAVGCRDLSIAGYSTRPTFKEDVDSIAIPIFENGTFYRQLEFDVTEALTKEIEVRTPYEIRSKDVADTLLTGSIRSVDQRLLSRTFEGGVSQELQLVVTADFQWKDLRSGEILRERTGLRATSEYVPTPPAGEPLAVARRAAAEEMGRRLVSALRSEW